MERALGDSYANNGWSSPHGYIFVVCFCRCGEEKECSLGAHTHTHARTRSHTLTRHLKRNRSGALGLNNNRAVARPMFWPEGENRFFWNERNNIIYKSACIYTHACSIETTMMDTTHESCVCGSQKEWKIQSPRNVKQQVSCPPTPSPRFRRQAAGHSAR